MPVTVKYKLQQVAVDLGVANKDLIALLKDTLGVSKKSVSVLNEQELSVVFGHYLHQKGTVPSLDAYFAEYQNRPKRVPPAPAAPASKATPTQTAAAPAGQGQVASKQAAAPSGPKAVAPAAKQGAPAAKKVGVTPGKIQPRPQPKKDTSKFEAAKVASLQKQPPAQKQPVAKTPPASSTAGAKPIHTAQMADAKEYEKTVRHVDTSKVDVNLDKYNEKYEKIAPQTRFSGGGAKKQKLHSKSAQRQKARFSNKRETEAEKLQRLELQRARKQTLVIQVPDEITVSELAARLKVNVKEVIKKLMGLGVMASQNELVDFDTAVLVAEELGAKVEREVIVTIEERLFEEPQDDASKLQKRSPIVVVMGHVDHGKTSLLDKIRDADVTAGEAGGITQHIGAYHVHIGEQTITFLDTPGHEAFTEMRARGALATDIAILVVAADDGIMPQTVEAINHAKAANLQIIVAINKMDKPDANPDRIKQELTEHDLVCEEWGGDVICCPVSAHTGEGIDHMIEMILLTADMMELTANPERLAKGTVIEARLDKGRGPIATLLVQNGTLKTGDILIAGTTVGRVRLMHNDHGKTVSEAGPCIPVEVSGLGEVPTAGDEFATVENERLARELADRRKHSKKEERFRRFQKVTLENLFSQLEEGQLKELAVIVKADVHGSVEAVRQSLEKLSNKEVRVRVIHAAVGAVNRSDLMLAQTSGAVIVGFNVRMDNTAREMSQQDEVEVRLYRIIYDAIDDIKQAMRGMLTPKTREVELGRAEVRQVYKISSVGVIAGCYVIDGKVARNALIRVVRDGIVLVEDKIDSLKRFKDDAKEVAQGYECGIGLERFNDIKEGDILESFILEEYIEDPSA